MSGRQRGGAPPPPQPRPVILIDNSRLLRRGPPIPTALIEERIAINHRELQTLIIDNQQLTTAHISLKEDLSLAEHELQQLSNAARKLKQETELITENVCQKSFNLQNQVHVTGFDALQHQITLVKSDILKLTDDNIELTAQFNDIDDELSRFKLNSGDMPAVRADVELMHKELHKGRAAIEFEKKTRMANMEQRDMMEENMVSVQREIDRLVAELADADKRARAAAAASAANPNAGYMGNYGGGGSYSQYGMHQAHTIGDGTPPGSFGQPVSGHEPPNMQ